MENKRETEAKLEERLRIKEETRKRVLIQDLSNFELRLTNSSMYWKYFRREADFDIFLNGYV
ncbi:MAG: hypothetical protein WCW54_02815 [Candidatus Paceibacterota bacterium]